MNTSTRHPSSDLILSDGEQSIVQALRSLSNHQRELFGRSIIREVGRGL